MEESPLADSQPKELLPQEVGKEAVLRPLEEKKSKNMMKVIGIFLGAIIIIGAGVATGNKLAGGKATSKGLTGKAKVVKTEKSVGSTDTKTFRDSTEGTLERGGLNEEGTHHLVRPGGDSQTAYLTSSVIDLDQYIGKKVKVFGETFTAQTAGWLMDVGKIELLE